MYKICFGIPAIKAPKNCVTDDGFIIDFDATNYTDDVWNDFELYQDEKGYHLSFETMLGFPNKDGAIKWINYCTDNLTDYMESHDYNTTTELNMYEVLTEGVNVNSTFNSIEDAYAFMKLLVRGFRGHGMEMEGDDE